MSMHRLGETRSRHAHDHLLQTPDTFVWAPLPGMERATACVHAAPALGAGFVQYTAAFEEGGKLGAAERERFVYVLEGALHITGPGKDQAMSAGGYAYIPPDQNHALEALQANTRAVVIEREYLPPFTAQRTAVYDGTELSLGPTYPPRLMVADEAAVVSTALNGDEALQVRVLLPSDPSFDFAVNTMEYQPGASLGMVEVHAMEHGLLMLVGGGIYRLGDAWYPVQAGDFIWMGSYCPQWFGALGKTPSKYLIYKNWNRHPAEEAR